MRHKPLEELRPQCPASEHPLDTTDAAQAAFSCLTLAHRARCAAAILLWPATESVRLGFAIVTSFELRFAQRALCAIAIFLLDTAETCRLGFTPARTECRLAHRGFCARLIFLRAAADIVRLPCRLGSVYDLPPSREPRLRFARLPAKCSKIPISASQTVFAWFGCPRTDGKRT
jgi:hypothetical protein